MPQTRKGPTVRPAGPPPDTNLNHRRNKDNTPSEPQGEISSLGKAALRYAAQGFRVFPCTEREKDPLGKLVPKGHKEATTDQARIRTWWKARPQANIGLVPDPGTAIIDVDPQNDGDETFDLLPVKTRTRLMDTLIAQTGGGGFHYILKGAPEELPGKLGQGIDLKRHGKGYIVVAPSIHPNGKKYRWVEGFDPERIKAWPTKSLGTYLLSLQENDKPPKTPNDQPHSELTPGQLKKILAKMDVDDYDDWIMAGQAFRQDLKEEGYGLWNEWSRTSSKYPGESEAKRKWRSFRGKGRGIGSLVHATGGKLSSPEPEEEFTKVEGGTKTSALKTTGFGQIEKKRVDWLVPGYVARGVLHCVAGYGGEGKSSAVSALVAAVTQGKHWITKEDLPGGPVSVICISEEPAEYQTRPRLELAGADLDRVFRIDGVQAEGTNLEPWNLVDHEKKTRKYLKDNPEVQLLIIDPIGNYMNGKKREINTWKDSDVRIALSPWQKLAEEMNISILYIAHFMKGKAEKTMNLVTGSAAFTTVTRMSYTVIEPPKGYLDQFGFGNEFDDSPEKKTDDLSSYRILFPMKVNIGPSPAPVVILFTHVAHDDNPKVTVAGALPRIKAEELMEQMRAKDKEDQHESPLQDKILEYVADHPGLTKNAICLALGVKATNEGTQNAFKQLEVKGNIQIYKAAVGNQTFVYLPDNSLVGLI